MLTPILHRKRKAAEAAARAIKEAGGTIEQTKRIYGTRLLVRGLLWLSIYLLSRGLLELGIAPAAARVAIALLPTPFFVYYLWTWMKGVSEMDELQRRIELEALGFAFPASLVFLATLGLLDVAMTLKPDAFSFRHTWLMMPMLYYIGLWRAQRKYQ
jgi:signal transduction histidine kinase